MRSFLFENINGMNRLNPALIAIAFKKNNTDLTVRFLNLLAGGYFDQAGGTKWLLNFIYVLNNKLGIARDSLPPESKDGLVLGYEIYSLLTQCPVDYQEPICALVKVLAVDQMRPLKEWVLKHIAPEDYGAALKKSDTLLYTFYHVSRSTFAVSEHRGALRKLTQLFSHAKKQCVEDVEMSLLSQELN